MSVHDIIAAANENNPSAFQGAVQDELNARIMAQLDIERQHYADTVFAADYEQIDMGDDDEEIQAELDFDESETEEDI